MTIRVSETFTGDPVVDNYQPRTELGCRLLTLRKAYVTTGGQLLDGDALDAEEMGDDNLRAVVETLSI